jgi:hypothetical protein
MSTISSTIPFQVTLHKFWIKSNDALGNNNNINNNSSSPSTKEKVNLQNIDLPSFTEFRQYWKSLDSSWRVEFIQHLNKLLDGFYNCILSRQQEVQQTSLLMFLFLDLCAIELFSSALHIAQYVSRNGQGYQQLKQSNSTFADFLEEKNVDSLINSIQTWSQHLIQNKNLPDVDAVLNTMIPKDSEERIYTWKSQGSVRVQLLSLLHSAANVIHALAINQLKHCEFFCHLVLLSNIPASSKVDRCNLSLARIREKMHLPVYCNGQAIMIIIANQAELDALKHWTKKHATTLHDDMTVLPVGQQSDTLIQVFDSFACQATLFSLFQYISLGSIYFDGSVWKIESTHLSMPFWHNVISRYGL